jgi:hypothetical protein
VRTFGTRAEKWYAEKTDNNRRCNGLIVASNDERPRLTWRRKLVNRTELMPTILEVAPELGDILVPR